MKRIVLFLAAGALHAASYYVSSAGNDSNAGSLASPWLTLQHAVNAISCGDTINIVANGVAVAGDADLPYFANCGSVTTIQSSRLSEFWPIGYRTNPTRDANIYGKLVLSGNGIRSIPEVHGSNWNSPGNYAGCIISSLVSDVFTAFCPSHPIPNMANDVQVEFEIQSSGGTLASATFPNGFSILTKYYVRNCSMSPACGNDGTTFQIATSPGGTPLSGLSCTGTCNLSAITFSVPLQVTVGSANIVLGDTPTALWSVNTPLTFSAVGYQEYGILPSPLQKDTPYYITSVVSKTIQVSATPGGTPIIITGVGTGPLVATNTNLASSWTLDGLEIVDAPSAYLGTLMQFGSSSSASTIVGTVHHMTVSRSYIYSQNTGGEQRAILDGVAFGVYRDNYCAGFSAGEAQCVGGSQSPGPTWIFNNFLEAAGEPVIYGGDWPGAGGPNEHKIIQNNYAYKPPAWRFQSSTGPASGACLYDSTDPLRTGGEWYTDTNTGQKYRCGSNGIWATTTSAYPGYGAPLFKNMFEHKNDRDVQYIGNIANYSFAQAQSGECFNNSEENGSGPGMANDHITISNNICANVYTFGVRESLCGTSLAVPCAYNSSDHATINNLTVINPLVCGVGFTTGSQICGYSPIQLLGLGSDFTPTVLAIPFQNDTFIHNTMYAPDSGWPRELPTSFFFNSTSGQCPVSAIENVMVYQNNIVPGDFSGTCYPRGSAVANFVSNGTFSNNALLAGTSSGYGSVGATNTWTATVYPATNSAIKYVNADGTISGDYHLDPTSPYSAANGAATQLSSDGTDLGADIDMVKMVTSGTIPGTPPVNASLVVIPGSTRLVLRYQAPTTAACTATIYNAPARIASNQVASVADSAASSISDVLTRQLYISGLTASTHYWYRLVCGGGVIMVGDTFTRAAGSGTYSFTFDWSASTAMRYSASANMASPTSLSAATRQSVPVPADSVIYAQVGTTGPIAILIAP